MPLPASGLAPWKFVLSSHLTDAAVRTYFTFLYTTCIDVIQTVHFLFLVTLVFLAVTRKWCKPHYQHRHQQQPPPKLVQPPHFRIMQVHQPDQICKHECMSHMPSRNARFHVDHGLPHWAPRDNCPRHRDETVQYDESGELVRGCSWAAQRGIPRETRILWALPSFSFAVHRPTCACTVSFGSTAGEGLKHSANSSLFTFF